MSSYIIKYQIIYEERTQIKAKIKAEKLADNMSDRDGLAIISVDDTPKMNGPNKPYFHHIVKYPKLAEENKHTNLQIDDLYNGTDLTEKERAYLGVLSDRGVETICTKCHGTGVVMYGSTSTWMGGIGGCAMTQGVCDHCWGSGDENKRWTNLREIQKQINKIKKV